MSLDFAILGQDGAPARTVPLSVDLHHEFITAARDLSLDLLLRFEDYYEDAEVTPGDLHALVSQVATLRDNVRSDDLRIFLERLKQLIVEAESSRKILHAIAD